MRIEKAVREDLCNIADVYRAAREFMRMTGNLTQWKDGYPSESVILSDIENGQLFKMTDGRTLLGVFCFFIGSEPTYEKIYNGEWQGADPCGVIHRVAVSDAARGKGVSGKIFDYCASVTPYLRIDTHRDNAPMRRALLRFGFVERGIIYLASGDERIAFDYRRI